jgi:NADPH:quinone reductase-like Zn-dependent oxidoreductase
MADTARMHGTRSTTDLVGTAMQVPTMQAVTHLEYAEPDVLRLREVVKPVPADDELLIRVVAAGVSIGTCHIIRGKPYLVRLSSFGGVPRPRHSVPGTVMAGYIEAVGARVTGFRAGDEVFGQAHHGAFAEFLAMPARLVAHKPKNLSFEEAAAVPWGTTALQGLRDAAKLEAGERVLVYGSSGAVGTWAVQIAKVFGAHVTAVCSRRNLDLMRSLGADEVIDYTKNDCLVGAARYDVFMDMVGNRPVSLCKKVLSAGGRYVPCSTGDGDWIGPIARIVGGQCAFLFGGKRMNMLMQKLDAADLVTMRQLVEAGAARPVVERVWSLAEVSAALQHVARGHSQGMNVIRIAAVDL